MGFSSSISSLHPPSPFGNRAVPRLGNSYSLVLISLPIALACSKALHSFGATGMYFPVAIGAVLCAWYGGVGPALACQFCGGLIVFSFFIRPRLGSPITAAQLYALLGFFVVGKLGLFLALYVRWTRDLGTAVRNFKLLAKSTNDAVWDLDIASGRMCLTGNLNNLFGYSAPLLETTRDWWRGLIHAEDGRTALDDLEQMLNGATEIWACEYQSRKADGKQVLVAARGTLMRDKNGKPVRLIGGLSDITAVREAQDRLAFEALHDPVTGLPNRQCFRDRVQQTIAALPETGSAAVLFLDLDRFKTINDSFGHAIGDKLLRAVSKRVELSLGSGETAARFGGDEFTILIPTVKAYSEATRIAEHIQSALATPFELEGHTVVITASIGIALGRKGSHPEDVLRHADVAMYRAKARGRARSEVFESDLDAPRMNLVQLESEIRKGIAEHEFVLYYQPIIHLRTGELSGAEALVRWQHPRRGLLPPGEFVPVAEESGLIRQLGAWVLATACADMRHWDAVFPPARGIYLNINVAEKQFLDAELPSLITSCLLRNGVAGSRLVLELTENMMLGDSADAANRMEMLRESGVRFALDDFGRGHSSLARLHELPISILKIDCTFIHAIDEGRPVLADAIIALAHELGLDVTAECVETQAVVEYLSRIDCTAAQGNFFGPPMSSDSLLELLRSRKHWRLAFGQWSGR